MENCEIVFHTASPFIMDSKNPKAEVIDPAVEGTRNVVSSVNKNETVKKIILTSSVAAIYGNAEDANKIPDKKPIISRNKSIDYIYLDNTFKKLNYKDIENFRDCLYSFYRGKKFPESFSRVSNKYLIFGTYIHSILKNTAEKIGNNKDEKLVIEAILSSTEDLEDTFYLSNDIPYEIELWKKLIPKVAKEVFCNSENILRSDFMPERSISRIYNNIKLVGRYDLKYKMNNQIAIVDFKVSSNLPSKKSIMDGDHLQLPFYSLIEPEVELFEYYFINISKNTTKRISFSRDDFEPIIENLKTYIDEINMHIENKTKY